MPTNNMEDIEEFSPQDVILPTHSGPVNIFLNTRAIDVPNKLNLLATAFRDFNVSVKTAWNSYINNESVRMSSYLNLSMQSIVDFINTHIVTAQNQFISNAETALSNLNSGVNSFKEELISEVGGYVNSTAYSVENSNEFEFSGETSSDEYDSRGRIVTVTQGAKTLSEIVYDNQSRIVSYRETLRIGSATFIKNYMVEYRRGLVPRITEV